jgi:peroxiredoxin Q/BCP
VSPDDVDSHQQFKSKFGLPFPLLTDVDRKITEQYGAWGERTYQDRNYMGVIRSHLVIDENGKVADAQYDVRPEDSVDRAVKAL